MKRANKKIIILSILSAVIILATSSLPIIIINAVKLSGDSCHTFRAEGLSLHEALPSALSYVRKYFSQSWCAPDSIISGFSDCSLVPDMPDPSGPVPETIATIAFTGDIMWIRNGWDSFLDDRLRARLSEFDMVFGNLETPVDTLSGVPSFLPDYARYNSHPGLIRSFRRNDGTSIFTLLSLANNHADDGGASGLERSIAFLRSEGIVASGVNLPGGEEAIYAVAGNQRLKIGFYSAGWGLNEPSRLRSGEFNMNTIGGIAPSGSGSIDASQALSALQQMKHDSVDLKVLYLHWGYEFEMYPDPAIVRLAHDLSEAGADVIIGSHPHVIQPIEIWEEKMPETDKLTKPHRTLIAYSLGNLTTAMYAPEHRLGLVLPLKIVRNSNTNKVEWLITEPVFVYNHPAGIAGRKRRLSLYNDFIGELHRKSPVQAKRFSEKLERVIRLVCHTS